MLVMAYERKILENTICPRCSYSKAELRLDVNNDKISFDSERILVYLVCGMCRLQIYRFSTNKKAIKIQKRIEKLQKALEKLDSKTIRARTLRANIALLKKQRRENEIGV